MRLEIDMPEHQYNNIMAIDSMSLGRAPYKGIIMYAINAIKHGRVLKQEPTTKNDLGVDCISRKAILDELEKWDWQELYLPIHFKQMLDELPTVTPQEPFKPMVEIDLYSVIKQKYIEREVLNKIREQIKSNLRGVEIALEVLVENHPLRPKMEGAKDTLEDCLELIDKAETEDT